MPIKKIIDPTTGIYTIVRKTNTPNNDGSIDLSAMRDLLNQFAKSHNHYHDHGLDDIEQSCEEILSSDSPGSHIVGTKAIDQRCRKAFMQDIESAKWCCKTIRDMLSKDDIVGAVNEAIYLGQVIERSYIRAHEHNASAGGKVRQGGRKAAAISNPSRSETLDRNKKMAAQCKVLRRENPHMKQAEIDRLVGKEFKRSARWVRESRKKATTK